MKQIIYALFITIIGLMGCKDKKQTTGKDVTEQNTDQVTHNPAQDSADIKKVIMDFYDWYKINAEKFQKYKLYSGVGSNDDAPYKINWDEVERYHRFISTSAPHLGQEFIKKQRIFFQQCDSVYKLNEYDSPYGFDYDWYTNSQEDAQELIDRLNEAGKWNIAVNGNDAKAEVMSYYDDNGKQEEELVIRILMKRENNKWTIAAIGV